MPLSDITTARLRLVATPAMLHTEAHDPRQLSSELHARVPVEWPDSNWEPHVFDFIKRQYQEHQYTVGWHRYVLLAGRQDVLIGTCNAHPTGTSEAEIGYAILKPWQGSGYASEATAALIGEIFASGTESIIAHTFPHLAASLRVMEKCGFAKCGPGGEGTVRYRLRRAG